jgi:hypothetical protein
VTVRAAAAALAACLLAAGCGDSDSEQRASPTPKRSLAGPEDEPGGAGDEQPIVQRVRLTVGKGRTIRPRRVEVTALLTVGLAIRNRSGRGQLVSVTGHGLKRGLEVGPGLTVTMRLEGLRPGRYRVQVEKGSRATLVAAL